MLLETAQGKVRAAQRYRISFHALDAMAMMSRVEVFIAASILCLAADRGCAQGMYTAR